MDLRMPRLGWGQSAVTGAENCVIMGPQGRIILTGCEGVRATPSSEERLFFALWPKAAVAEAIAAHWRGGGGVMAADLHMTLAFLGATCPDEKAMLMTWAEAARGEAFAIRLDRVAYWEKPAVVVLEPRHVPLAGLRLAERVRGWAVRIGRPLPDCRPHVTLARRQKGLDPVAPAAIDWHVEDFVLARSDPAASPRYTILARWPLS
ncbi:MAG: hypothetical protein M0Z76_06220 [Gammaproteobacteria bacterium]|nr:hypothetical protein [Gammaproteobacteria bacterium]